MLILKGTRRRNASSTSSSGCRFVENRMVCSNGTQNFLPVGKLRKSCRLSAREITVTRLLRRGLSNKEIARELDISVATVKHHVHSLLEKLNLPGRVHVARAEPDSSWGLDARERVDRSSSSLKRA